MLQNNNLQINKTDKLGINAFWIAASRGHVHILECLAEGKIAINQCDLNGRSALHIAAKNGHMPVVEYLVRVHKMNANIAANDGRTPLIYATKCDKPDLASFLIKYGANINIRTHTDMTPLLIATRMNSKIMVKILVEKGGADINLYFHPKLVTALFIAVTNGNAELVNYFCDRSANIAHQLPNRTNVIMLACWKGFTQILKVLCAVLLRRGQEDLLSQENSSNGYTPLTYALLSEHFACAEVLLNLKQPNRSESELLSNPAQQEKKQLAEGLSLGLHKKWEEENEEDRELRGDQLPVINVNAQNSKDLNSTLHLCVMKRKAAAISFLVERGANINLKNKQNLSPKMLAEVIKFKHPALEDFDQREDLSLCHQSSSGSKTPIFTHLVSFGPKILENIQQQMEHTDEQAAELKQELSKSEMDSRQPEDQCGDNEMESHRKEEVKKLGRVKTEAAFDQLYLGDDEEQSEYESKSDLGSDQPRYSEFSFSMDFKKGSNADGSETKQGSKTNKRMKQRRLLSFKHSTNSIATAGFPNILNRQTTGDISEAGGVHSEKEQQGGPLIKQSTSILEDISEQHPFRSYSTQGVASKAKQSPKKESQFSSIRDSKLSLPKNDTQLNEFEYQKDIQPVYLEARSEAVPSSDQLPTSPAVRSSAGESQPKDQSERLAGTDSLDQQSDSEKSFEAPLLPHNPAAVVEGREQKEETGEAGVKKEKDSNVPHCTSLQMGQIEKELKVCVNKHKSDQNLQSYPEDKEPKYNQDHQMAEESHEQAMTMRTGKGDFNSQANLSPEIESKASSVRVLEEKDENQDKEKGSRRCSTLKEVSFLASCASSSDVEKLMLGNTRNEGISPTSRFSQPVKTDYVKTISKLSNQPKKIRAKKQESLPMERKEEQEEHEKSDDVVDFRPELTQQRLLREKVPLFRKKTSTRIEPEGQDPIPSSPPHFQSRVAPELAIESEEIHNTLKEEVREKLPQPRERETDGSSVIKRVEVSLSANESEAEKDSIISQKESIRQEEQKKELFKYRKSTDLQVQALQSPRVLQIMGSASSRLQGAISTSLEKPASPAFQAKRGISMKEEDVFNSTEKTVGSLELNPVPLLSKMQTDVPKIPQKTNLGQLRSTKPLMSKAIEVASPLASMSPQKNINMLAGLLSPYINMKISQVQETEKKKKKDIKHIYADYRVKGKPSVSPIKNGTLRLPQFGYEEEESLTNFQKPMMDLSPLKHKFVESYGTPHKGIKVAGARISPRKEHSPLFIPQSKANLLNTIHHRGKSVMDRLQKDKLKISPNSIGRSFNNNIVEERVEKRRNQLKLGHELRSKIVANLFRNEDGPGLGQLAPPKIPQLAAIEKRSFKDQV